ncbi:nitric oxide-associated protein 1 [Diorhabda carinulata]|uniref:nitric oxide-associated protein 1 n=1 Tax=Diorhabda carinulata TaxID=1163345 RepID=UPI0025A1DA6D|nr:nitric oxide-associated protein 1 [Diorhabda carinulata]
MIILKFYRNSNHAYCVSRKILDEAVKKLSIRCLQFSTKSSVLGNEIWESKNLSNNLLFNSIINAKQNEVSYFQARKQFLKRKEKVEAIQPLPLSLKYLYEDEIETKTEKTPQKNYDETKNVQFPYYTNISINDINTNKNKKIHNETENVNDEIRTRYEGLKNWMNAYDNLENDCEEENTENNRVNYGTPDPLSQISNVPCGGCGAYLHCKDTAIPGYIPSEIFKNAYKPGGSSLEAIICQRCFFFKEHDIALQVRVSAEDYPKVLTSITNNKAMIILMVDLTDFPCSIWPGIADILGRKTPIFVVGNKIDLIPKDTNKFISIIKQKLLDYIKVCGFGTSNILGITLISAKTGYGIEELITSLHSLQNVKGDVYLVGCTNVGKSTLFNALLGSDFCKTQALDLIQRATTSQWPGTTLNLLKFPILRPSARRLYMRNLRLTKMSKEIWAEEERRQEQLKVNNIAANATLIGRIEHTFPKHNTGTEKLDGFSVNQNVQMKGITKLGINPNNPEFALGRWCYDTPGVVHPDQILDLLTLDELILTLPKELIKPETFCIKPGTSLYIAGLARLDYLDGPDSIKLTVFRSNELPITICKLELAEKIYNDLLGTELFKVPIKGGDRLTKWPGLEKGEPFRIEGIDRRVASNDVVLSNAGWISTTGSHNSKYSFQAWTPEKRGIYLRDSILPKIAKLRGKRIGHTVAYEGHTFI